MMPVAFTDRRAVMAPAPGPDYVTVKALTGTAGWTIRLPSLICDVPATAAYLAGLMITTATLASSIPRAVHWLVASASTNLHNMRIDPLRVLVVSAFWVQSTPWIWLLVPLVVAVLASAELLLGTRRTLLIFAVGHLGATALTVAAIANLVFQLTQRPRQQCGASSRDPYVGGPCCLWASSPRSETLVMTVLERRVSRLPTGLAARR
jgi:hypothetical protein